MRGSVCCFFFNDTATTEIYTLSLHDALPICSASRARCRAAAPTRCSSRWRRARGRSARQGGSQSPRRRSEEHTSELQSRQYLVCRLLLEKKTPHTTSPCPSPLPLPATALVAP